MKIAQILVATAVTTKQGLTNGLTIEAILPHKKGSKVSYVLLSNGRLTEMNTARINGVGISRAMADLGYVPAQAGDDRAIKLADFADIVEGLDAAVDIGAAKAGSLQRQYSGMQVKYIPFDPTKPSRLVTVRESSGFSSSAHRWGEAFADPLVQVKFGDGMDLGLAHGWVVDSSVDEATLPRSTDYGGPVEHAVFVLANIGVGELVGAKQLAFDEHAADNDPFPRGKLVLKLSETDSLMVGITGVDELGVVYIREGEVVYRRDGMSKPEFGQIIGDIYGAVIRVQKMDADAAAKAAKKKPLKKAA